MHVDEVVKLDIINNFIFINKIIPYTLNFSRTSIILCKLFMNYDYRSSVHFFFYLIAYT